MIHTNAMLKGKTDSSSHEEAANTTKAIFQAISFDRTWDFLAESMLWAGFSWRRK